MSRHAYPKEWIHTKLEDVATIQTGIALNGKVSENTIRLPYLRVANVQDSHLDLSEIKYIDLPKDKVSRYTLQSGDVLLTEGGDFDKLGRGTIWKNEIPNCVHQNHIFVVRTDKNRLLPCFLESISSSYIGRTYFLSCSKQTTNLASINSTQLKQMPLVIPPLPEQKKIAEILGTWDEAIEKAEKLITAKQKLKKGLMQQLLTGKKRFKEFKGERWKEVKLDSIYNLISEKVKNGLTTLSITAGVGFVSQEEKFGKDISGKQYSNYIMIREGDFCYNKGFSKTYNQGCVYRLKTYKQAAVPNSFVSFRPINKENIIDAFYEHWFVADYHAPQLKRYISSGARSDGLINLNKNDFFNIKVPYPSIKEQQRIASVLDASDQEICLLQKQLEAMKQQKKGLMQKLLTGKIRVKV